MHHRLVSDILGDLKAQARAMGDEIEDQNEMIDRINDKATANNMRIGVCSRSRHIADCAFTHAERAREVYVCGGGGGGWGG